MIKKINCILFISILFITGCGKKIEQNIKNVQDKNESNSIVEINDSNTINNSIVNTNNTQNDSIIDNNNQINYTNNDNLSNDEKILNYFVNITGEIKNFLNSDKVTNIKEKCREYFITFVDFIFFDSEINGVTFTELKDTTKKQVITITKNVDSLIMEKFPNYKEDISSTSKILYDKAISTLNNESENLEDYIISKIGEQNYQNSVNNIEEIKENDKETLDKIKEYGNNALESSKEKLNNWYQKFKEK